MTTTNKALAMLVSFLVSFTLTIVMISGSLILFDSAWTIWLKFSGWFKTTSAMAKLRTLITIKDPVRAKAKMKFKNMTASAASPS